MFDILLLLNLSLLALFLTFKIIDHVIGLIQLKRINDFYKSRQTAFEEMQNNTWN